jgi:sigma-B regulation protein RsbU (phosphoserine phosphatase)
MQPAHDRVSAEALPSSATVLAIGHILRMVAEREHLPRALKEVVDVVGAAGARIWWRMRSDYPLFLWGSLGAPAVAPDSPITSGGAWSKVWSDDEKVFRSAGVDLPAGVVPAGADHEGVEVWALIPSGTSARGAVVFWWSDGKPALPELDRELLREALSAFTAQVWWRERWAKRKLELELLEETNRLLAQSLDRRELLEQIFDLLGRVVHYDAGGIFVIDAELEEVGQITARGYDAALQTDLRLKIGQGLVGYVAKTGHVVNVPDVRQDDRYVNAREETRSALVVPVEIRKRRLAVLNLESNRLAAFDPNDEWLVASFANQVAIALDRARLFDQQLQNRKLREQLLVARSIQESFLPKEAPKLEGYDIAGINYPSEQVGGDYYDFVPIVDGQWGIAIADVSGKGIPAALIMAGFRASLIAEIRNNYAIRIILRKVNNVMREMTAQDNFITAFYGVLDARNRVFTFTNGGHNAPLLLRAGGSVERLREGGPLIGVIKDAEYEERPVWLGPGDVLLFYTDGVSEATSASGEEFGERRLVELVARERQRGAEEICAAIHDAVIEFAGPDSPADDVTLILVKVL